MRNWITTSEAIKRLNAYTSDRVTKALLDAYMELINANVTDHNSQYRIKTLTVDGVGYYDQEDITNLAMRYQDKDFRYAGAVEIGATFDLKTREFWC